MEIEHRENPGQDSYSPRDSSFKKGGHEEIIFLSPVFPLFPDTFGQE